MKTIKYGSYLLLMCVLVWAGNVHAQTSKKKPELVTDPAEIQKLKSDVEANPDDLKKQQDYIKAVGLESPDVQQQYDLWMKKFPASAIFPFAIG